MNSIMDEPLTITVMDGVLDDKAINTDIICIINVDFEQILKWIDKHKERTTITYKNKKYSGAYRYPRVFIFDDKSVLEEFIKAVKLSEKSLDCFILNDIFTISSTIDMLRVIKIYNFNCEVKDINNICLFIDRKSFDNFDTSGKLNDFLMKVDGQIITINDIDFIYNAIFYV